MVSGPSTIQMAWSKQLVVTEMASCMELTYPSTIGGVIEKVDFVDGMKNGIYYRYERGKIVLEMNYVNNVTHGALKRYYSNGNIQEESNYSNGVLHGNAKWYDQQGNVTIEYTYEHGELVDEGDN